MNKNIIAALALLLTGLFTFPALAQQQATASAKATAPAKLTEEQKIARLIQYVRGLEGATFIRNGSEHSAVEAADHLKMKRERAGSRIKTARDFIEQLASKSSMSGKNYQIRFKDGKVLNTHDVLMKELERLEK